ncbi:putative hexokinase family protein [Phaeomoniella chlamydospora]|uniref:Phosphotransferase n=1 Tax=Phaeomoniella chlamydospora TaxID=158046 RepID=A0A0G2FSL9_PHACM|nr:putative hexokinase family protein [Phaeomoniella chlamydospora]
MSGQEESPEPLAPNQPDTALQDFTKPLVLDESTLHQLAFQFSHVYKDLALNSDEQFLPTPVTKLPTGNEIGQFLAIDVGGTNLRVGFIDLLGEHADNETSADSKERSRETIKKAQRPRVRRTLEKAWPIGEHLKIDKADDLFAWIGDCIADVVADKLNADGTKMEIPDELPMGVTFSFPMKQDSLSSATLMPTGKGFTITADTNLGSILLAGYARHTRRSSSDEDVDGHPSKRQKVNPLPKLKITAITNDTVATLASLAYSVKALPNSRVAAGIIVGTGCNATIPMPLSSLGESKSSSVKSFSPQATETVVNTEMTISGACAPLYPITTKWDRELDAACPRPGFQPLEYMTGGRYIGELVRIIFHDYMTTAYEPKVPTGHLPAHIVHPYSFPTTFVSSFVARARSDEELAGELRRRIPPPESSNWTWSPSSAKALRLIARLVQTRSAGLIAASTIGLLACVGEISLAPPNDSPTPTTTTTAIPVTTTEETSTLNHDAVESNSTGPLSSAKPFAHLIPTRSRDGLSPGPGEQWKSGPEELVIAYTGGIIQHYPNFKEQCQRFIDHLVMRAGPQEGGKSVFLREATDGGIIGAGVLAGMEALKEKERWRRFS